MHDLDALLAAREHVAFPKGLGDLGVNFGERGNFNQAVVYLRQALELQRDLHAGLHPDLAEAMNNLAWALQELGEYDEAETLYRESLYVKRKLLGDAHPELAAGLINLAYVLETRGDYRGAEKAYREELKDHPRNGWSLLGLQQALKGKGASTTEVDAALADSWARADTWIKSSAF